MKRSALLIGLFLIATLLVGVQVARADDVSATKHNLQNLSSLDAAYTGAVDYGEICVYCHTPHNGNTTVEAPLWNRNVVDTSGNPYTMYSSPTIDMTIASQPTGVSLACLSCHDGTLALDVIVNKPQSYTGSDPTGSIVMRTTGDANYAPNLTQDLSNDHPVSVTYDTTADTAFNAASGGKVGDTLPLFGTGKDQVQCATCHNPHNATDQPFLRVANASSALCTTCHIK
ncbi:MAG: cytochrome c3 family protein [Nitrospinota bacterium]